MLKIIFLCGILFSGIHSQFVITQDDYSPSVYYFNAIELAADGDFADAQRELKKYSLKEKKISFRKRIIIKVFSDVENRNISEEAGQYIFKAIKRGNNARNYLEQITYLNHAMALNPKYEPIYLLRGEIHLNRDEYNQALFEFSKMLEINPESDIGYYFSSLVYKKMKKLKKALNNLNSAIRLNPNLAEYHIEKFQILVNQNEGDLAIESFKNAYDIDSTIVRSLKYSALLNDIGVIRMGENNYEKALMAFNQSINADPRWIEPYLNRGITFRKLKKYDQSIRDYNKAIKVKPEAAEGYYNRALTYLELEKIKEAEKDLNYSLVLDPNNAKANYKLGNIYYEKNNIEKAIFHFKNTLNIESNNTWALYWLGICYDKKGNYKEAKKYYKKFLELVPKTYFKHRINIENRLKKLKKL